MKKYFLGFMILTIMNSGGLSQSIGIGTTTPHSSAVIDINSNNKGALLPRMTSGQRKAIVNPAPGLLVFDISKNSLYFFDGVEWRSMTFTDEKSVFPIPRTPTDNGNGDFFGNSVSISGDYAIVGANGDIVGSNFYQGSAYIFKRTGGNWLEQTKLIATDGAPFDGFGISVSISGDYAVVGVPGDDTTGKSAAGSVYVFHRNGNVWTQQTKLWAYDATALDQFGSRVTLSGNYLIVGAPLKTFGSVTEQGAVYVFVFNGFTWEFKTRLTGENQHHDHYGSALAFSGIDLVIGAPGTQETGNGSVYKYFDDGGSGEDWVLEGKLTSSDGMAGDGFGSSVSVSGTYLIVGAPNDTVGTSKTGSAYIFFQNSGIWTEQVKLTAIDGSNNDFFGASVSISGENAVVGARWDEGAYVYEGSAYLFKRTGTVWSLVRKVEDFHGSAYKNFGSSVAMWGFDIIIGSPASNYPSQAAPGSISFLNIE